MQCLYYNHHLKIKPQRIKDLTNNDDDRKNEIIHMK